MSWIVLSLFSAVFLGLYEIAKKSAARDNAVPPVLLCQVLAAAALWIPLIVCSQFFPQRIPVEQLRVDPIDGAGHALLFAKSVLAGSSWIFALFGLKHLPISIAAPIRSSSPVWTILIATFFLQERPDLRQWCGVIVVLTAFLAFSLVGRREGIRFIRNRWVGFMIIATLLGALSAIYDKYLLQQLNLRPATVQAWFSVYLIAVMLPLTAYWYVRDRKRAPFEWRGMILLIAIFLQISDFLYFTAIAEPDSLISVISPLRRSSVIVSFLAGIRYFGELHWRPKAVCIAGMLTGIILLSSAR